MSFDQIMADEYRYNRTGETVSEHNERVHGERRDYFTRELKRVPEFVTEKMANVYGAPLDRIMQAVDNGDTAELGAAVMAVINDAAKQEMDDFYEGVSIHEKPEDLLKWWWA